MAILLRWSLRFYHAILDFFVKENPEKADEKA